MRKPNHSIQQKPDCTRFKQIIVYPELLYKDAVDVPIGILCITDSY